MRESSYRFDVFVNDIRVRLTKCVVSVRVQSLYGDQFMHRSQLAV